MVLTYQDVMSWWLFMLCEVYHSFLIKMTKLCYTLRDGDASLIMFLANLMVFPYQEVMVLMMNIYVTRDVSFLSCYNNNASFTTLWAWGIVAWMLFWQVGCVSHIHIAFGDLMAPSEFWGYHGKLCNVMWNKSNKLSTNDKACLSYNVSTILLWLVWIGQSDCPKWGQ